MDNNRLDIERLNRIEVDGQEKGRIKAHNWHK